MCISMYITVLSVIYKTGVVRFRYSAVVWRIDLEKILLIA